MFEMYFAESSLPNSRDFIDQIVVQKVGGYVKVQNWNHRQRTPPHKYWMVYHVNLLKVASSGDDRN